jgi:hypothetical protein
MKDEVKIEFEEVDPHRLGWQRHPTRPNVWVTDNGRLYVFGPHQREVIIRLKGNPLDGRKFEPNRV